MERRHECRAWSVSGGSNASYQDQRRLPIGAQDAILSQWACGPRNAMKTSLVRAVISPDVRFPRDVLLSWISGTFSMVPHFV